MSFESGDVLEGRYLVGALLGRGGMADVWEATDQRSRAVVAIKAVHLRGAEPDLMVARFEREAKAAARIEHAHVCRLLHTGQDEEGAPFLVFERLYGQTLAERVQASGAVPLSEYASIATQVQMGLAAAHGVAVVHRDLKPSNIFLCDSPPGQPIHAKILDFGVAKMTSHGTDDWSEPVLTTETATVGSIAFMAPEQADSARAADVRADIYALGVTGFVALTGRLPYPGNTIQAVMALKKDQDAPSLGEVTRIAWPGGIEAYFSLCLARRPEDRFANIGAAQQAWLTACQEASGFHAKIIGAGESSAAHAAPVLTETAPSMRRGPGGRS